MFGNSLVQQKDFNGKAASAVCLEKGLKLLLLRRDQLASSQGTYLDTFVSLPVVFRTSQGNNGIIFFPSDFKVNFLISNH